MVPTIMVDAIVTKCFEYGGQVRKIGELVPLAYGPALQMRALGLVGGFKNEDDMHLQATELMAVYGGDSWFPHHLQTVSRVADYLSQTNAPDTAGKPN